MVRWYSQSIQKQKKHALVLCHAENGERGYSYVLKNPCISHNILFILGTSQMDG